MADTIFKPIFVIGMPRSGTSVFYRKLGSHPDLAWISKATRKFPTSPTLSRLIMPFRRDHSATEAPRVWSRFARPEDDVLSREDVTEEQARFYRQVARTQMKIFNKPRFLAKYPRNALRLSYLDEIFPDALFIHFIRDGRAVSRSVIDYRIRHGGIDKYWGIKPPRWKDLLDREPYEAVGLQWKMTIEYARQEAQALGPSRYMELTYETFCDQPADTLKRVGDFCELSWSEEFLTPLVADVKSQNFKWRDSFSHEQMQAINRVAGDLLTELQYEL